MAKNLELLLTENVEALGIVGDVVRVRTGYARNYLLPRDLATKPSEEKIKELSAKRAEAQRQVAEFRKHREELSEKLQGVEVHLIRSCNDQGILYGAITQQDIATELNKAGHAVKPRDVRLGQVIKRIDTYDVHIKLDSDLDATVKLWVVADRKLDIEKAHEPEPRAEGEGAQGAEGEGKPKGEGKAPKGDKSDKAAKGAAPEAASGGGGDGEKKPKKAKGEGKSDGAKAEAEAPKSTGGWGKVVDRPDFSTHRPAKAEKHDKHDKDDKKSKKK